MIVKAGRQNDVPLMAGWTSAETKWVDLSLAGFQALRHERFPDDLEEAEELYPADTEAEAYQMGITMSSDSWIVYPTWKWIELQSQTGKSPIYRFLFDQVMATPDGPVPANDPGAARATDIPFVFNVLEYTGNQVMRISDSPGAKPEQDRERLESLD